MKGERKLRPSRANALGSASMLGATFPFLALVLIGLGFPLFGGGYWGVIATRACVYWVLVSGLNLVVGFAGQIAIGWVALLTLGAYTTSVLAAGNATPALSPYLALTIAAAVGAVFGLIIGLPALRLRTFYFAITTLGFATIVTQVALAWQSVTRYAKRPDEGRQWSGGAVARTECERRLRPGQFRRVACGRAPARAHQHTAGPSLLGRYPDGPTEISDVFS